MNDLPQLRTALEGVRSRADRYDQSGEWPADDLADLAAAGAMRAAVPSEFAGDDLPAIEIHLRYEQIAARSLSTALILSQRDSACGLIDVAESFPARAVFLRELARNDWFTTVGIAQLTTSRQRGSPALLATPTDRGYRLNGSIPWCSGAAHARFIIAGAVVASGSDGRQQILFALPRDLSGVRVEPPLPLVAMRSTHTSVVSCDNVELDGQHVLVGPTEQVLSNRRRNLSIGQAFLAMGLCRGALDLIEQHDSTVARQTLEEFESQLATLRRQVIDFSRSDTPDPALAPVLRGSCNELAMRITHSAVAIYKGTALLEGHPAQRMARESMFLLVWSCPNPVIDCTLELMRCAPHRS